MKLSFARIVTRDVAALTRFYQRITGITPHVFSELYAEFADERVRGRGGSRTSGALSISSQTTMDSHGAHATTPQSNGSVVLDFQVDDVDIEYNRVREFVKYIVLEPTNQPWGNRSMLFRDPDGNLINFFAPIESRK